MFVVYRSWGSPVILDGRSVGVLVWVGNPLRWESIHLLVDLGSICIELCPVFLARDFVLALLEGQSVTSKSLLQLSCLRIEAIIVLPLVFKIDFVVHTKGQSAYEGQSLENADLAIKSQLLDVIDQVNLPQLECERKEEQGANTLRVFLESLVLQNVLVLEVVIRSKVVAEVLHVVN